ncbi:MAG: ParB/RepB/Spo0J family partition protein [Clostridia bacterium]|nr:ParB/RepB/Spo0J family partition protein [Clostridia bacterium]
MKQTGLGRGLDALFTDNSTDRGDRVTQLSAALILPDENQNRTVFESEPLEDLAASIRAHGILQPLLVRPDKNGTYRIVAGERRFRAGKMCGMKTFPVIIRDMDVLEAAEVALIENLQRENLNPIDEARGFLRLTSTFALTQEQAAERVGKSRAAVANALRLLKLPPKILALLEDNSLSAGHARALLSLPTDEMKLHLAARILSEKLSVRDTEREAKKLTGSAPVAEDAASREHRKGLEERLRQRTGYRVQISPSKDSSGGKISLSYKNTSELEEIITALAGEDFLLGE